MIQLQSFHRENNYTESISGKVSEVFYLPFIS